MRDKADCPILFLTARVDEQDVVNGLSSGRHGAKKREKCASRGSCALIIRSRNGEGIFGYYGRPLAYLAESEFPYPGRCVRPLSLNASLTFLKQAYAVFFALVLSLVRGVAYSNEIGITLGAPMAILAFTCCADTYGSKSEMCRFFVYLAGMAVTLGFWGSLSNLIFCLFRNMWGNFNREESRDREVCLAIQ